MNPEHIPYHTQRAIADIMAIRALIAHLDISGFHYLEDLKSMLLDDRRTLDAHDEDDFRSIEILSTIIWACNHALDQSKGDD